MTLASALLNGPEIVFVAFASSVDERKARSRLCVKEVAWYLGPTFSGRHRQEARRIIFVSDQSCH